MALPVQKLIIVRLKILFDTISLQTKLSFPKSYWGGRKCCLNLDGRFLIKFDMVKFATSSGKLYEL